jgi:hypothetical protein
VTAQDEFDFLRKRYPDSPGYARVSRTSFKAAVAMTERAPGKRAQCLAAIKAAGEYGATCDEVQIQLGMIPQTASARFRELAMKNLIVRTDRERMTRNGKAASVYVAAEEPQQ